MSRNIGLFVGSFDPVHEGHVGLVDAAITQCKLDSVIVVPEKAPRRKKRLAAVEHRMAMLRLALPAKKVVIKTIASEYATFPETFSELGIEGNIHLLIGSDVAFTLKTWPGFRQMMKQCALVIGVRNQGDVKRLHTLMAHLEITPDRYTIVVTPRGAQSSSQSKNNQTFHPKIVTYIQKHHLYEV